METPKKRVIVAGKWQYCGKCGRAHFLYYIGKKLTCLGG